MSPLSTFAADEALAEPNSGGMIAMSAPSRTIQEVPALLVMLLNDTGKLPLSKTPDVDRSRLGFRVPGVTDMKRYTWVAEWEGPRLDDRGFRKVAGVAAYRDDYDYHTASDVREIVSLRGSGRAVVNLVLWMRDDARAKSRRLIGYLDGINAPMRGLLEELEGAVCPRIFMEDAWTKS